MIRRPAWWAACIGLAATGVGAADIGSRPDYQQAAREAYFSGFDRNADGRVVVEEYIAYLRAGFDYLDANGNGRIDDHELPPGARRSASRNREGHERAVRLAFARLDTDRNGWLSVAELTAPPR